MIPQFDLKKEYAFLKEEIQQELKDVFSKTNFIGGDNVNSLEKNYSKIYWCEICNFLQFWN